MFRSGRIPELMRSDRGQEFKSLVQAEFASLMGYRQHFGAAWRPVEQGGVERVHQEVQKILGIMVLEVFRAFPDGWTELLVVTEFVWYATCLLYTSDAADE